MMSVLGGIVVLGHLSNLQDVGNTRWFIGFLVGAGFTAFYQKVSSAILSVVVIAVSLVLIILGLSGKVELADPGNRIALAGAALGGFIVLLFSSYLACHKEKSNN